MSDTKTLKLDRKIFIQGEIKLLTGMHVGGSSLGLGIGGADKVVIRNPVDNLPYIPGSSLKGKMRSLLEKSLGLIKPKYNEEKKEWIGELCINPDQDAVQLFGFPADVDTENTKADYAPTRLIVRDSRLLNEQTLADAENTDMYCTEIKTEVAIDRLTSKANPRQFERVPAGARFGLNLVLDLYNVDAGSQGETSRADRFVHLVCQAMSLVEDDYIGGQGTRGYGQVEFLVTSVTERTADSYRQGQMERQPSEYQKQFALFMNKEEAPV
jgi:CRISPR-associated protein Csm3